MLDLHAIKVQDISALSPSEWASFAGQLLAQINEQSKHIAEQTKRINADAQAIKWRDAKIESITFQLAQTQSLEVWRQDRAHECPAALSLRRDTGC
jgi:transposase